VTLGHVDEDGTDISEGLGETLAALDEQGVITLVGGLDESEARSRIGDDLDAVIVVPAGFGAAAGRGGEASLTVLGDIDADISTEVARSIASGYTNRLRSTSLAVATLAAGGADPASLEALAAEAAQAPDLVAIGEIAAATRILDAVTYFPAAMAVFFVFFTVQSGVTSLLDERREGTMYRLLAAPIPHGAILGGKALSSFLLGVGSMAVLVVASTFLIGADFGDPLAVGLLVVAVVLAALGIMAIIAGLAKTPESAANIQSIVAVSLGALGGSFFQISGEGLLAQASLLTPHRWFLDGLAELAGGGGVGSVLPAVGAILVFGVATGAVGWMLLSRRLVG
jgi:ABC-2 type transport system permease protein